MDSNQSSVAGVQTSGCTLQVAPSSVAAHGANCANGRDGAHDSRIPYYSANVRFYCVACGSFNVEEDDLWLFCCLYRIFQWVSVGRRVDSGVRIGLDSVYPAKTGDNAYTWSEHPQMRTIRPVSETRSASGDAPLSSSFPTSHQPIGHCDSAIVTAASSHIYCVPANTSSPPTHPTSVPCISSTGRCKPQKARGPAPALFADHCLCSFVAPMLE